MDMDSYTKTCPRCGLHCPQVVKTCPCGFDLVHGDASAVRGVIRRRGRKYLIAGLALIVFGLLGGMSFLPIRLSFVLTFGWYRMDVGFVVGGLVLFAKGARMLERPWSERLGPRSST